MTIDQISLAFSEAPHYADVDAFVSDLLLSSSFLPKDETSAPDPALIAPLRAVWTAACASFPEFLRSVGLTQSGCSRRFGIPLRTVQGWALGERQCPAYIRRMIYELSA